MQMHTDREVLGWRSAADIRVSHWMSNQCCKLTTSKLPMPTTSTNWLLVLQSAGLLKRLLSTPLTGQSFSMFLTDTDTKPTWLSQAICSIAVSNTLYLYQKM